MFEIFERLEAYFDTWYSKGYLLIASGLAVLMLVYYFIKVFV